MARKTSIELDWADGTYLFHLDIPRLKELQEKCDAGPPEVLKRLVEGRARVEDVQETVRLGLIGGGLPAPQAAKLVRRYAGDETPLAEVIAVAILVLGAAVLGNAGEEVTPQGNPEAAISSPSMTVASTSPPSAPTP